MKKLILTTLLLTLPTLTLAYPDNLQIEVQAPHTYLGAPSFAGSADDYFAWATMRDDIIVTQTMGIQKDLASLFNLVPNSGAGWGSTEDDNVQIEINMKKEVWTRSFGVNFDGSRVPKYVKLEYWNTTANEWRTLTELHDNNDAYVAYIGLIHRISKVRYTFDIPKNGQSYVLKRLRLYSENQSPKTYIQKGGDTMYGKLGIMRTPEYDMDIKGSFRIVDYLDSKAIMYTRLRQTKGYAGGVAHKKSVLRIETPYETSDKSVGQGPIAFSSPEIWGQETPYMYSFGTKNLRLGIVNDGTRRSEIELYNNNTSQGRIIFRTGGWKDPANIPGSTIGASMIIDHKQNVGIGVNEPTEKLEVNGNLRIKGQNSVFGPNDGKTSSIRLLNYHDGYNYIQGGKNSSDENAKIRFSRFYSSANLEELRISADTTTVDGNMNLSGNIQASGNICDANGCIGDTKETGTDLEVIGVLKVEGKIVSDGDICIGKCD